ncbi:MAG: hypothetical protein JRN23_04360, partial [Nitrososphaerota archaeon]|nr:hypothetical protein [Nitrososphaerota archaeon]
MSQQTCAFNSNPTAGDTLIVAVYTNAATLSSITDSQSNSFACHVCNVEVGTSGDYASLFYAPASATGADTVTIDYPSAVSLQQLVIEEYNVGTRETGYASGGATSGTSFTVTSFTPTVAATVVAIAFGPGGNDPCTPGSGYTAGGFTNFSTANMCDEYSSSPTSSATSAPMSDG